ncbi:RING finger and transmembrane domain-containing protein 2-like [Pyrus ussuriensis x Pyrus communis]|uniref:RING finger and transmembrane domain-containing protein 2-like n=1 Tax=Pyrus ussuriensis x Pyrus communis TaxID=2448454 RepID=A0A5N5HRD0_9ROSA|nr:RING finger and transmembrane domain-containing protein 2-like [Pyrus x bretschneideri]KAB2630389.1 RING finger and transmembrane domain-containing protein 2-like [Pyrus ussuriensis x Pyrus communis]
MEGSGGNLDSFRASPGSSSNRRYGVLSASNIIRAPISTLLEYSGILRGRSSHQEAESLINGRSAAAFRDHHLSQLDQLPTTSNDGEVSIRIIGAGEQEHDREGPGIVSGRLREVTVPPNDVSAPPMAGVASVALGTEDVGQTDGRTDRTTGEGSPQLLNGTADVEGGDGTGANGRDSSYQRYDIQQAARGIEQVLPFSLLLLVVFIRQHLQGFFVTIWIAAVMFKSNDILRKQTALKGERKITVLMGISLAFASHVVGVYWWFQNDDLLYPLIMLPPKVIPPFWHAVFIIMVNDTLVRQAAMVLKCSILMYYKNSRGRNYRKQGQMLTLVEYLLLLYRALLPTPVWYRFFLNKEYGSLFSSLMTGLYLTFKLTSVVEKVQSFFAALKALSRKEVHYGAYATSEQVNAAGDLCAICQEKMHAPILLRCKHIFCEDCVSEWFERERTCPLCRALVKPADLRSFGDGSTSLFFQLF